MTRIGASKIAEAVVFGIFPIPRHVCVQNVSWSMLPYEADLLAMTDSGYLIEVEVKISLADLKRDADKAKWKYRDFTEKVSRFYYAMPEELWAKPAAQAAVRQGAGVIVVKRNDAGVPYAEMVIEAARTSARKLTDAERYNLARVGSFRAFGPQHRHRLRQLKAEHEMQSKLRLERFTRELEKRRDEQA